MPLAIAPFQGRILVGVGKLLRIYDLGKKKLLRKCENKVSLSRAAKYTKAHICMSVVIRLGLKDVLDKLLSFKYLIFSNHYIVFSWLKAKWIMCAVPPTDLFL